MPSDNKNGRGSASKRSRSRAITPERSARRKTREQPPSKRRGLRSSDVLDERSRRFEFVNDRARGASTSRPGRQTRNSRGIKRKASSIEPGDDEEIQQPQVKRQRVVKEGNSSQSLSKSAENDSKRKSILKKNSEDDNDGESKAAEPEKKDESDDENETKQKRKEGDSKDGQQKKQDESKGQDKSDAEDEANEKDEEAEKKKDEKGEPSDKDDDDGEAIAEDHGGESTSSGNATTEASKPQSNEGSSNSDGAGKSSKKERSSCMGCCNYRDDEDKQIHEHLRIPPKGASDGLLMMPSGMLAGVGLSSLDELMPLPQHQQDNDDWTMESLMEFFASSGCVSPPLPPQVSSDGQLDLEWLLDMYDIDMSQEYHTNINGTEDAL